MSTELDPRSAPPGGEQIHMPRPSIIPVLNAAALVGRDRGRHALVDPDRGRPDRVPDHGHPVDRGHPARHRRPPARAQALARPCPGSIECSPWRCTTRKRAKELRRWQTATRPPSARTSTRAASWPWAPPTTSAARRSPRTSACSTSPRRTTPRCAARWSAATARPPRRPFRRGRSSCARASRPSRACTAATTRSRSWCGSSTSTSSSCARWPTPPWRSTPRSRSRRSSSSRPTRRGS